jgi:hypothetical protein
MSYTKDDTIVPPKRTLLRGTLPDHMFTMLMGEDVPPREEFRYLRNR